jgi:hypothetical protein
MKKLIMLVAFICSTSAFAGDFSVSEAYNYDQVTGNSTLASIHRSDTTLNYATDLGTVYGGAQIDQAVTQARTSGYGGIVGYSNGTHFGNFGVNGHVSYEKVRFGSDGDMGTVRYGVEGTYQFYSLTPFVGAEHADTSSGYSVITSDLGTNYFTQKSNRYTLGTDVALSKRVNVRFGYAYTDGYSHSSIGLTSAVTLKF